ncbi:MAG TPA: protein phosphatase 2C domain-containing protein [Beijerinckiaceae bacterium]
MLTILDSLSWAGAPERANEDAFGCAGAWAWVIDGFIVSDHLPCMSGASDATWFVRFVSGRFAAHAPSAADGPDLVRRGLSEARAAFLTTAPSTRGADPASWPAAALTLIRARDGVVDCWSLGDTVAYVEQPDGTVAALGEAAALREAESRLAGETLRATGLAPDEVRSHPAFRAAMRRNRERHVDGSGPTVLGMHPDVAQRLDHRTARLKPGGDLLLATDGFSALCELYSRMSPDDLVEAASGSGLEGLARELRRLETEVDPLGQRWPRFKRSDDATALLVRYAPTFSS